MREINDTIMLIIVDSEQKVVFNNNKLYLNIQTLKSAGDIFKTNILIVKKSI